MILEARDPRAFSACPGGGFVAGKSWLYFGLVDGLLGYSVWGSPSGDDMKALVRVLEAELARPVHDAFVDFEHLEEVAPAAFDPLARYAIEHEKTLARIVTRAAIVRPARAVTAAVVTGFFEVSSRPFPVTFVATMEAAVAALDRLDHAVTEAVVAARATVAGEPELLRRVRALVTARPSGASLEHVARALGLSERTLQRRLAEHHTSFEAQVQDARLFLAQRLLRESETPVTAIALDLGFATAQHFATLFRKRTGVTPSTFRTQRR